MAHDDVLDGTHGRYRRGRELGRGGFGVTRLGTRESDGLEVAVKTLRIEQLESWKALELFEREAAVLRSLDHPNIPRYIDDFALPDDAGFALVQTYIPGPTLRQVLERDQRLSQPAMAAWFKRLLEVCAYLHGLSPPVIHRDINPKNIILRERDGEPVLIDFGTVQAALKQATRVASTVAGTFGFSPPEQFVGRATPASDLYSLAMTWLAVASGMNPEQMPFAENRVQVRDVLAGIPVDARLMLVLEEMTEPDAAQRPRSVERILARLSAVPTAAQVSLGASPAGVAVAPTVVPAGDAGAAAIARYRALADLGARLPAARLLPFDAPSDVDGLRGAAIDERGGYVVLSDLRRVLLPSLNVLAAPAGEVWDMGMNTLLLADGSAATRGMFGDITLFVLDARGQLEAHPLEVGGDVEFFPGGFGRALALRPDGAVLAHVSGGPRGTLFDVASGKVSRTFALPPDIDRTFIDADDLRFTPDGSALVMCLDFRGSAIIGADGQVDRHADLRHVAFSADGRRAAVAKGAALEVGEVASFSPLKWRGGRMTVWTAGDDIELIRFSPDGALLAAAAGDKQLVIVDVAAGSVAAEVRQAHRPGARFEDVDGFGFTADNRLLVVHAKATPAPAATEAERVLTLFAVARGRSVATVADSDTHGLVVITADGLWAPLAAKKAKKKDRGGPTVEAALALARGEAPEQAVPEEIREATPELAARVAFWTRLAGAGRVLGGEDLARIVTASAGIAHLLPRVVQDAASAARTTARFGDTVGPDQALPAAALLAACARMQARSADERAVLFHEQLPEVAAEADSEARRERKAHPKSGRRVDPWVAFGMIVAIIVTIWLAVSPP